MVEIMHMERHTGDRPKRRMVDIYVKNSAEARTVDTSLLIQGSKLLVIETMELFILDDDGGVWRNVSDGAVMR